MTTQSLGQCQKTESSHQSANKPIPYHHKLTNQHRSHNSQIVMNSAELHSVLSGNQT